MRYFNPGLVVHPPLQVTWNPADKDTLITLSGGNLTATTNAAAGDGGVRATFQRTSGKWYFELNFTTITGGDTGGGMANGTTTFASLAGSGVGGIVQFRSGNLYRNGVVQFNNSSMVGGGILKVAYDADAHRSWVAFAANNWNNSGAADPATGVGGLDSSGWDTGGAFPLFVTGANADACTVNLGASSFTYGLPVGFNAWNG